MEDLDKFCGGDIDIMDCPRPFFGAVIGPGSGERRPRTRRIGCFSMNRIRVTYLWGLAWPSCCQWKQAMIAGDGQRSFHAWRTFALLVFGWGCCQPTDSSRSLPFGNIARAVVLMTSAPWSEMSALRLDAADELQVCSPATTDRFNRSRRTQHPPPLHWHPNWQQQRGNTTKWAHSNWLKLHCENGIKFDECQNTRGRN